MKRTSILLFVAAACSRPSADKKLGAIDSTFAVVCGTASDSIPFTRVDLGPARTSPSRQNNASRELIQTEMEWTARWAAVGDSTPAPKLNFQDSVVILVASQMFESGPASLEIEAARKCVGTDDIVVPVRAHTASTTKQPERSIRAIQIAKAIWKTQPITFIDMPPMSSAK
jgi:hypothetical protein